MNEIIQESGLEPALKASRSKDESQTPAEDTSTEDEDIISLIDKIMKKAGLKRQIKLKTEKQNVCISHCWWC